ncbi:MAG: ribosome small subunit-dependent GTPase A [Acidimicrobiales bacterium]|nr:ribosome small subunit-dependent GTPase A [Acidimicrobiales bacterium]
MTDELGPWGLAFGPPGTETAGGRIGRVVRVDRGECDVMTADGRVRVLSDSQRAQDEVAPVTGDWVVLEEEDGLGTVVGHVFDRTTSVSRRDPAERDLEQVLASNVQLVAAVHGLDRPLPPGRLERLLVLAHKSGAEPVVILTKGDEAVDDEIEAVVRSVARDIPVIVTSTVDGRGLDDVVGLIGAGRTLALVGASGVGKSSLVNAILGEELLEIGDVRSSDAKGRHTTTARELILLPDDAGLLLDTPGIRAIGLWEAEDALDLVFGDLEERAASCRFGDCAHRGEPGCAIAEAVDAGEVDGRRVDRYRALVDELAAQREREEERERRERKDGPRRGRGRRR